MFPPKQKKAKKDFLNLKTENHLTFFQDKAQAQDSWHFLSQREYSLPDKDVHLQAFDFQHSKLNNSDRIC